MAEIERLLEELRTSLVETGMRNRLINVNRKSTSAKAVPIIDERSDEIFRILRLERKKMRFAARGTEDDPDNSDIALASSEDPIDEARLTDIYLDTPFTPDGLQKKLLRIARDAKTAEEEQGINVLYLAMGFLKWFENEGSDIVREAPLILIPVELVRNQKRSAQDIVVRDDDIVTNQSLQERLHNNFGIQLPEIDDSKDWSPADYFSDVEAAIQSQPQWSIDKDGMQVGFFSFAKLLMLKDLDPKNWPEDALTENPIIKGLLSEGFEAEEPLIGEGENLDEVLNLPDILHVIDADASQTKVIEEARSGRNLVVQGPPGTGKSQTITNILAAAVHDGKKVLFVAEKMAALNVVHRRMENLGLQDLCLELHSRYANKKSVLGELASTISKAKSATADDSDTRLHIESRDQLNDITSALHSRIEGTEYSPFEILSKLIHFLGKNTPPSSLSSPILKEISKAEEEEILEIIDEFVSLHKDSKDFTNHPYRRVRKLGIQPVELQRLIRDIKKIIGLLDQLSTNAKAVAHLTQLDCPESISAMKEAEELIDCFKVVPNANEEVWETCLAERQDPTSSFDEALRAATEWTESKKILKEEVLDVVWDTDLQEVRQAIYLGTRSWWRRTFGSYRSASRTLSSISKKEIPQAPLERLEFVDSLLEAKEKKQNFDSDKSFLEQKIGASWRDEKTNFKMLLECWEWLQSAPDMVKSYSPSSLQNVLKATEKNVDGDRRKQLIADIEQTLERISDALHFDWGNEKPLDQKPVQEIQEELRPISQDDDFALYGEWDKYSENRKKFDRYGLIDLLHAVDSKSLEINQIETEFLYALYETRWELALNDNPRLEEISKIDRHKILEQFMDYEKSRISQTRELIKDKHLSQLPTGAAGEMGFLRGEIAKKTRHKPIRQIMKNAAGTVQRIKPVFLMSPISVAQFLPPGKLEFDLLIIDEASQVKPADAIGSVARAKQIIVVGDQKQLPPTIFFDNLMDGDDKEDDSDEDSPATAIEMESILTLCNARAISSSMLKWHYRSRDPSLIACSNDEFYDNNLILPPSPTAENPSFGMSFQKVAGVYSSPSKGGGRRSTNRIEAEKIADRLSELAKSNPTHSVGIAAFSKLQADMITEVLELRRRSDPALNSALSDNVLEPVFVKNIENIQGDERDIILISVGYGPHKPNGRLTRMNFGPVSGEGGERRLNVLFSRARIICEIYCSFNPNDIDLSRAKSEGARVFKKFLDFAKTGRLPQNLEEGNEPDSEFEEDVAEVIRSLGYKVSYQVGSEGFRIDLGVKSLSNPNNYILAVECDGATYHSALWARERDRLRQEVLEHAGWQFHRIWSTDWFYNKASEIEKLRVALSNSSALDLNDHLAGANNKRPVEETPEGPGKEPLNISPPKEYNLPLYTKADISKDIEYKYYEYEPHEVPQKDLGDLLAQIIQIEGPVHIEEIARRYIDAFGATRLGSRILQAVKQAISSAQNRLDLQRQGDFWGTAQQFENPSVRNRSAESSPLTKAEYLSKAEILAAAKMIESDSGKVEVPELAKSISRLVGFKKAGPAFQKRVEQVLNGRDK